MAMRLLVVDDEEMNRDLLSRRLIRSGYEVLTAASGAEALALLESRPIDLLLLDLMMPGMSGIEVLERVRRKWPASDFPIVMVTAVPEREGIVAAMHAGANDYIVKPVDYPIALARIEARLALAAGAREQRQSAELYRLASHASDEGLWDWDLASGQLFCSPRWKSLLGFCEGEIGSRPAEWLDRIHPADRERCDAALQAHLNGESAALEIEHRMRHKDGRYRWVECRGGATRDASGRAVRLSGYLTDIDSRKTLDPVTLLHNRTWLESAFEEADSSAAAALILIELDSPSSPIPNIAARLAAALAGVPAELVCTGDRQLAVFLRTDGAAAGVESLGAHLRHALEDPSDFVSASMGIAMAAPGERRENLLRDAHSALRHARELGRNQSTVFHQDMRQREIAAVRLESDLRRALDRQELVVFYQPKVDLQDYTIAGFEALVRWRRPGGPLVMPNDFIPLAEETGLIVPLGRYVLEQSCRDTVTLLRDFPMAQVSVNVSGRQFAEPRLAEIVREVLDGSRLRPEALRLEVTETAVMNDAAQALATMRRLREMGVGLKLDDFGAGYSSLAYLRQFPFDTLKIDRSFVLGMRTPEGAAIVRTVVDLARSLQLSLVAEGIEYREQAEVLREMGCGYGQGYWFSRAVELPRLRELLQLGTLPAIHEETRVAV
jgi:PAS domain S-box-containing protein